jgi:hypothetical protein
MNTQTTKPQNHAAEVPKKGFLSGLFARIDEAMKKAAEQKANQSCCCSGDDDKSGKGGKCC